MLVFDAPMSHVGITTSKSDCRLTRCLRIGASLDPSPEVVVAFRSRKLARRVLVPVLPTTVRGGKIVITVRLSLLLTSGTVAALMAIEEVSRGRQADAESAAPAARPADSTMVCSWIRAR